MIRLVDASLWVDLTRVRSPGFLKRFVEDVIVDESTHLSEPVLFEVMRHAAPAEQEMLEEYLSTFPVLPVHADVWTDAAGLGRACRAANVTINLMDLVVAAVAMHHDATVVTFDKDFGRIAEVSELKVQVLRRPTK